jgi:hypothetical protein
MLAAFRCSTGPWYEDDVESFITRRLIGRHVRRQPHVDHRVIGLELPDHGLVAVTAHEQDFTTDGPHDLTSSLWIVAAVVRHLQGAILPEIDPLDDSGRPVSLGRYLAETALSDIAAADRAPVVRAIVARENTRSLALCDRLGLGQSQPDADARFVQRLGVLPD